MYIHYPHFNMALILSNVFPTFCIVHRIIIINALVFILLGYISYLSINIILNCKFYEQNTFFEDLA